MRLGKSNDTGVTTIEGVELSPHSIGDVKTNWKDDTGKPHNNVLKGALLFRLSSQSSERYYVSQGTK